ncbi:MAG: 50S ribosomal protein L10 [bacterium]|nr:50S ribosomal protein L10 [bacterium]
MLTRDQKIKITEEFAKKAKDSQSILLVDFTGLKMSGMQSLRRDLRQSGVEMKVIKKTLVQRILKGAGVSDFNVFQYPASVAMVFSPEEGIIVSKNVYDFSKKSKTLKILGGFIGKNFIDAEMIVKLAKLPSRGVLLGQLAYVLNSLPRILVGVLHGNLRKLVIALDQISKTK